MGPKAKISCLAIALALLAAPAAPAAADAIDDARAKADQMRADARAKADQMRADAQAKADATRAAAQAKADATRAEADRLRNGATPASDPPSTPSYSYRWAMSSYGTCSKTCGGGTQTRSVSCRRNDGLSVSTSFCSTNKPQTTRSCNTQICSAEDTQPPSMPTGLTATAADCSEIDVSWNAATDSGGSSLEGYDVYRDGNFYTQVMAPLRSLSDGNLPESTTHFYQVAAFDGAGNRSPKNGAKSATTPACGPPVPAADTVTLTLRIPDYVPSAVVGVNVWQLAEGGFGWRHVQRFFLWPPQQTPTGEIIRYTPVDLDTGVVSSSSVSAPISRGATGDDVTLTIEFDRPGPPARFKVSTFNAAGESPRSLASAVR
jgi:hypothetical protein